MRKTFVTRKEDVERKWYLVDAKDKVLGRMATRVAILLRGKHKAVFSPSMDAGDGVIVVNAAHIKVTGRKMKQKVYSRYSGYPGGLRQVTLENMLAKKPEMVVRLAVQRMLPGGPLGRDLIKKLKVYAGETHKQRSQQPVVLDL
ncbi:MAG: 50S ribosomal protein L13 [Candidatus Omnitrophota bacterium]|jgi:large subunit ribosomal protein L13